ncbi:hypothetical protein F4861DRAFT_543646 [Xylaria intraflava]|nr:hypothetical protein F4861DRAFT_543646 [Xylaria intraflava]
MAADGEFPDLLFDFGGKIVISKETNQELIVAYDDVDLTKVSKWAPTAVRRRKLYAPNHLGISETSLENTTDIHAYWTAVLRIAPPRPWFNIDRLLEHLATSRPFEKPANSKTWRIAREWLGAAIKHGRQHGWRSDTPASTLSLDETLWEAIRIIGDAEKGFAMISSNKRKRDDQTSGTETVDQQRVEKHVRFAETSESAGSMAPETNKTSSGTDKTAPYVNKTMTLVNKNTPQVDMTIPQASKTAPQVNKTASQKVVRYHSDMTPFVRKNEAAEKALQKLEEAIISDYEEYDETAPMSVNQKQALLSRNTKKEIRNAMKQATIHTIIESSRIITNQTRAIDAGARRILQLEKKIEELKHPDYKTASSQTPTTPEKQTAPSKRPPEDFWS